LHFLRTRHQCAVNTALLLPFATNVEFIDWQQACAATLQIMMTRVYHHGQAKVCPQQCPFPWEDPCLRKIYGFISHMGVRMPKGTLIASLFCSAHQGVQYTEKYRQTMEHTPVERPFSGTTQVSWYQKGKINLDFTEARDSEWQWHRLGNMQVCTLLQTDNHASTPPLSFFKGRMPFLPPNQQRQSTEGTRPWNISNNMHI